MDFSDLNKKAIQAAVQEKWENAIDLNENILKNQPQEIKALNRLAHAYFKTGNLRKAKKNYKAVLKIDRSNLIAQRNLEKLANIKSRKTKVATPFPSFLEESGKTKTINLVKLASCSRLLCLEIGQKLTLCPKKHGISLNNEKNEYVGAFPDDLAKRLLFFISKKSQYAVFVKLVEKNRLVIFVKEIYKSPKTQSLPSFPQTNNNYLSFLPSSASSLKEEPLEIQTEED